MYGRQFVQYFAISEITLFTNTDGLGLNTFPGNYASAKVAFLHPLKRQFVKIPFNETILMSE